MTYDRTEPTRVFIDGFIAVDEDWRCTRSNATAAELLHAVPGEVEGKALWELLPNMLDEQSCAVWRRTIRERGPANLGEHHAPDGRCYACRCFPSAGGVLICFLDVTERERTLQVAKEQRQRIEDFLAELAHELRNPLSAVSHGVALLRGAARTADQTRTVDLLERQLRYFMRIVDDLLDVSRIARGRLEIRRALLDIGQLIACAVGSVEIIAKQKAQRIDVSAPSGVVVDGDFIRLQQVLINLLRNAVAYSDPGGAISISAQQLGSNVKIRVRDAGRGIAPERLPLLFESYFDHRRERSADRGLGIGLGVVHRIVQLHGGTVTAHSEGIGRGAEFVVRLPVSGPLGE